MHLSLPPPPPAYRCFSKPSHTNTRTHAHACTHTHAHTHSHYQIDTHAHTHSFIPLSRARARTFSHIPLSIGLWLIPCWAGRPVVAAQNVASEGSTIPWQVSFNNTKQTTRMTRAWWIFCLMMATMMTMRRKGILVAVITDSSRNSPFYRRLYLKSILKRLERQPLFQLRLITDFFFSKCNWVFS